VKLRVNYLSRGRYWHAGEEIPDEDVPPNIRKYALSPDEPVPKWLENCKVTFVPAASINSLW
jgi:hypothetical protein